jgi:hypothetical protein
MKVKGSDLRAAAARRKMRQPASEAPRPSPHQAAHEPVDAHERWPFAWSAMVVVTASLLLWGVVIGGGFALARLFG